MIMHDYDMNDILSLALRSKSGSEQLSAITRPHGQLSDQGQDTCLHILDNEAPLCVTSYLNTKRITYQLVPLNVHRRNAAERAISTWKYPFVAVLCYNNPSFPMHLCDHLLPQCDYTLNTMRTSRLNPTLSAHHHLYG